MTKESVGQALTTMGVFIALVQLCLGILAMSMTGKIAVTRWGWLPWFIAIGITTLGSCVVRVGLVNLSRIFSTIIFYTWLLVVASVALRYRAVVD